MQENVQDRSTNHYVRLWHCVLLHTTILRFFSPTLVRNVGRTVIGLSLLRHCREDIPVAQTTRCVQAVMVLSSNCCPKDFPLAATSAGLWWTRVGLRGGDIVFQHVTVFVLQGRVWLARHRKLREVRRGLGFRRLGFRVWARS